MIELYSQVTGGFANGGRLEVIVYFPDGTEQSLQSRKGEFYLTHRSGRKRTYLYEKELLNSPVFTDFMSLTNGLIDDLYGKDRLKSWLLESTNSGTALVQENILPVLTDSGIQFRRKSIVTDYSKRLAKIIKELNLDYTVNEGA